MQRKWKNVVVDGCFDWRKEKRIMNLNGNYCLTTTSKRPTHNKRMVMRVCVCVCMIWNRDCLFVLFLPVKLLTITAFNRSFHNGTWNSPRMRHSFIFLRKEECNDSKLGTLRRVWRYQRGNQKQYKRTNDDRQNIHIKLKIE